MYPVNALSLQTLQTMFLSVSRRRTSQTLVGPINGSNRVFKLPNGETFVNLLPNSTITLYLNGLRLSPVADYVVQESMGTGTGFDQVQFVYPLLPGDYILADYVTP